MQSEKMKNMIILKNLPSNIIDEAFIILKGNKKNKVLNSLANSSDNAEIEHHSENYIIKEAEMVISNYMSKIENEKYIKSNYIKALERKYKKLKLISIFLFVAVILVFIT